MIPKTFTVDLPEELAYEAMKCKTDEEAKQVGIEWYYIFTANLIKTIEK